MGLLLTRERAKTLGLRPARQDDYASEVDALVASAAPRVADDRRRTEGATYSLLRADGKGDTLLEVVRSEKRRGRPKALAPEEEEFLDRRLGAIVREPRAGGVEVEFFRSEEELEDRWRAIRAIGKPAEEPHRA